MQLLLLAVAAVFLLDVKSIGAPASKPVNPAPPVRPAGATDNWGAQLGALFAGLGQGTGAVIDSFNNEE